VTGAQRIDFALDILFARQSAQPVVQPVERGLLIGRRSGIEAGRSTSDRDVDRGRPGDHHLERDPPQPAGPLREIAGDIDRGRCVKFPHHRQRKIPVIAIAIVEGEAGKASREITVDQPLMELVHGDDVDATRAKEIAKGLVEAQNPRIAVGRLRTPEGVKRAVELAELVGASTSTAATGGPMSFPQRHPLCGPGADTAYDYTLGLGVGGAQASITGPALAKIAGPRDSLDIGFGGIRGGGRGGRGGGRGNAGAPPIEADAEASIPLIIEEVKRQLSADRKARIQERAAKHARANHEAHVAAIAQAVESKRAGWNGVPISTARVYAELWPLIMNEDWCLSSPSGFSGGHHAQLWDHNKPYSYLGGQGAGGMGYGAPASVGAALAAKARNRIVVNIQCDGDLNYAPGVLWTAVHHKLPMLTVMHNNRAWHQEFMFVEYMAGVRGRGEDRAYIGSTLRDPYLDYAKMAAGYGMAGEGPITDPAKLSAALKRGVASVKRGEPYLIDVVTQPR